MKNKQLTFDTVYVGVNQAKAKPPTFEELSKEMITEQAGYVPPKIQIENMILAGRRLNEARLNQFDFPNEDSIDENAKMIRHVRAISISRTPLKCISMPSKGSMLKKLLRRLRRWL